MYLLEKTWKPRETKYEKVWLADDDSQLTAGFDPDSTPGSAIIVIATGDTWMKNSEWKWQKVGTTEVLA